MATKFDSKEYAKSRFLNLCEKYFPIDYLKLNISRKGFKLGENTITLIEEAQKIVNEAEITHDVIPRSTADIFRYGTVLLEIFNDLSNYQTISQIKSRSRRGYRKQIEVIDFDQRKIEYALKKSPSPSIKTEKDEKMISSFKKEFLTLLEEHNFSQLQNNIKKNQKLFILDETEGFKLFHSLSRLINNLFEKINERKVITKQIEENKSKIEKLHDRILELQQLQPQFQMKIKNQREISGFNQLLAEKEQLLNDSNLSLFLKILTTSLERYIKMVERRENRKLEQRDAFLGLILDPARYPGLDEPLWREIVFILENHGIELLSSKSWFNFSNSDELRQFIVNKENLFKFSRLRKLEEEMLEKEDSMMKNDEYRYAYNLQSELKTSQNLLENLEKNFRELNTLHKEISKEISEEEQKAISILH